MGRARKDAAERFRALIERTSEMTRHEAAGGQISAEHALLATWQCERLGQTYADFHKQKRYRAALDFFLTDIYGPSDFSQRDQDIARVYPIMVRTLTVAAIDSLTQALELHAVSMALDHELIDVLFHRLGLDVAAGPAALTPHMYAEAYRLCDNYDRRLQQIDLAVEAASILESAVRKKMIYLTVKIARRPARAAGFGELQSFLERGLAAFTKMKGSHRFLDALAARERHILDALYDDAPVDTWYGDILHSLVPADGS